MEGFTLGLALVEAIPVFSFGISMVTIAGRFDSPVIMIGAFLSVLAGCCRVSCSPDKKLPASVYADAGYLPVLTGCLLITGCLPVVLPAAV